MPSRIGRGDRGLAGLGLEAHELCAGLGLGFRASALHLCASRLSASGFPVPLSLWGWYRLEEEEESCDRRYCDQRSFVVARGLYFGDPWR